MSRPSLSRAVACALLVFAFLPSAVAAGSPARVVDGAPGVVRVILWDGVTERFLDDLRGVASFDLVYRYEIIDGVAVAVHATDAERVMAFTRSRGFKANPDRVVRASLNASTATVQVKTAGGVTGAWDLGYTGKGVTVAVLDTGMRGTHVSLDNLDLSPTPAASKILTFRNFVGGNPDPPATTATDDNGHGTHVSGIAAGTGQNSSGSGPSGRGNVGVAYNANLVGLKVLDSAGSGSSTNIIAAINWARNNKALYNIRVMNMSFGGAALFGGNDGTAPEDVAIDNASAAGIVSVVAAGNGTCNGACPNAEQGNIQIPADAFTAIAVCSSASTQPPASPAFSNWDSEGPTADGRQKPEVCAPGDSVVSAGSGSNTSYVSNGGTSMSSPHVAGVVALMIEAVPSLTPAQIRQVLIDTASHTGSWTTGRGHGEALARAAIQRAIALYGSPDTTPPSTVTGLSAAPGDGRVTLTWAPATDDRGVDHYEVFMDGALKTTSNGTSAPVTGLTNGQSYEFKVRAVDAAGNKGGFSAPLSATPQAGPRGWPQFHNDLGRTAYTTGTSAMSTAPPVLYAPSLGGAVSASPLVEDIDGDGEPEIVAVADATQPGQQIRVSAFERNGAGALVQKWTYAVPVELPGAASTSGFANAAIGDLDGNGTPEVVVYHNYVFNGGAVTNNISGIKALNGATGAVLGASASAETGVGVDSHPAIGDVWGGDGVNEVVVVWRSGTPNAGSNMAGFSLSGGSLVRRFNSLVSTTFIQAQPALADVGAHPGLEIVTALENNPAAGTDNLYVCSPAGSSANCVTRGRAPSWPYGIAIDDLDGNGNVDVVVNAETDALHVFRNTAPDVLSGPTTIADGFHYNTPALADVNGDGRPDIVNVANSHALNEVDPVLAGDVTASRFTGSSIVQMGRLPRSASTPGSSAGSPGGGALADIDGGDGRPEFVFGSDDGSIEAVRFSAAGVPSLLWDLPVSGAAPFSPPAIADVNADGKIDIIIGGADGVLRVLGLPAVPVAPPGAPTGLSAVEASGTVSLNWTAPASDGGSPVTGYNVYRGTSSGSLALLASTGPSTSYPDTTAAAGTTYYYKVAAVNSAGEGASSNEASVTTKPPAPTGLGATGGDATVSLAWTAPSGSAPITSYRIYRGTTSGSLALLTDTGSASTSYVDNAVVNGTTYHYAVAAQNAGGIGPASAEASATPSATPVGSLAVTPSSVSFGSQRVGTTGAAETVTVTNDGTASVDVTGASVIGSNPGDFSLADACTGATLTPGSSCTIDVSFAPAATGARSGTLRIASDVAASPHDVTLDGTGIEPVLAVEPGSIAFGNARVGTTTAARAVTVRNTGTDHLAVGAASLTGGGASQFTIASDACSGSAVSPGGSCAITVSFAPSSTGAKTATLSIPTDAGAGAVSLGGTGVDAVLTADPSGIAFGPVRVGTTTANSTVTATNLGTDTVAVGTLSISGSPAFVSSSDTCSGASLAPGASCTVRVRFAPTEPGAASATLRIPSDAPGSPAEVALSGSGTQGRAELSPSTLAFGSVPLGRSSAASVVTVRNAGDASFTVDRLALVGSNAGDFSIASTDCSRTSLAPTDSCQASVVFTPAATGPRTAQLQVWSDAPSGVDLVTLNGTGGAGLEVSPASLSFAAREPGTTSAAQRVRVANNGSGSVSVGTISTGSPEFPVTADACTGVTLASGEACAIDVAFRPGTGGTRTGTLTVPNSFGTARTVALSGYGLAPTVSLSATGISFGNQAVASVSPGRALSIRNAGGAPLVLGSISFEGAGAAAFGLTWDPCGGTTVPVGGSCEVRIAFAPAAEGPYAASLRIPWNGGSSSAGLDGVGVRDSAPPVSAFSTRNDSVVIAGGGVSGRTTEALTGVTRVAIRFAGQAGTTEVTASLACTADRSDCTWFAAAPLAPGIYTVTARGTDGAGNTENPGPSIRILVV